MPESATRSGRAWAQTPGRHRRRAGEPLRLSVQPPQQLTHLRSDAAELFFVGGGKLFKDFFSTGRERQIDLPAIRRPGFARDQAFRHQAVRQFHGAVVAHPQSLGQLADGEAVAARKSFDCQERLVLLRREAGALGGLFAEMQKLPQGVAERREGFVLGL